MSDVERESPPTVTSSRKPPRTLACVLCQQRKVRCDRKFPCNTCIKTGVQCVPVAAPRQRRRRFPEGELLQRVRHLEDLLRQNNMEFEPLHATASERNAPDGAKQNERSEGASPEVKTETTFEAKFVHFLSTSLDRRSNSFQKPMARHESKSTTEPRSLIDGKSADRGRPANKCL